MITETSISSEEIIIEAPVEKVWAVLVDFDNYGKWNQFCPDCQAELTLGSPVVMKTYLGEQLIDQVEYMSRIDPCEAIAWRMENKPGDPIHAERTQYLKKLSETSCSYLSVDEFSGEQVPAMMEFAGEHVENGFNLCARGLKDHCESQQ